jgi:hypothetical protein
MKFSQLGGQLAPRELTVNRQVNFSQPKMYK